MAAGIRAIELAGKRKALLDELAAAVPPPASITGRPGRQHREAHAVRCPFCLAPVGEPCVNRATRKTLASGPHPARIAAAPHTTNIIEGL